MGRTGRGEGAGAVSYRAAAAGAHRRFHFDHLHGLRPDLRLVNDFGPPQPDPDPTDSAEEPEGDAPPRGLDPAPPEPEKPEPVPGRDPEVTTGAPTSDIDQQTLLWAIAGDDAAFARLIQHYDSSLCELVFAQVGAAELMDRVLASTYRKAYRSLPRLRNAINPGAWLSSLAAQSCAEELRRQAQRKRSDRRTAPADPPPGRRTVDVSVRVDPGAATTPPPSPILRPKPAQVPGSRLGPSAHDESDVGERVTLIPAEADDVNIDLTDSSLDDPSDIQLDLDDEPAWGGADRIVVADGESTAEPDSAETGNGSDQHEAEPAVEAATEPDADESAKSQAEPDANPQPARPKTAEGAAHLPGFWNRLARQLMAEREVPARPAPTIEQIRAARAGTNADTSGDVSVGRPGAHHGVVRLEPASVEELAHRTAPGRSRTATLVQRIGVVTLVVVAIGAVGFLAFRIGGNAKPINRTRMTNAKLADSITSTLAKSRTVAAMFTAVTTDGGLRSTKSQLFFNRNGSFRLRTVDGDPNGSTDIAYDATTGVADRRVVIPGAGGPTVVQSQRSGLATGPPDSSATIDPFFDGYLPQVLTAMRAHPDIFVTAGRTEGKDTWVLDVTLPHEANTPDKATLAVDQQLLVPVQLQLKRNGVLQLQYSLSDVVFDQAEDSGTYSFPFSDGPVDRSDDRFQRSTLSAVPNVLNGFQPATPTALPDGYDLAGVAILKGEGDRTGTNGANPPSTDVVSLTYRRGWETVTLTTRTNNVPAGRAWQDPFVSTGTTPPADTVKLSSGRFAGADAQRVAVPGRTPYLWGTSGRVMFTATGNLTADDLVRLVGSIR